MVSHSGRLGYRGVLIYTPAMISAEVSPTVEIRFVQITQINNEGRLQELQCDNNFQLPIIW